MTTIGSSASNLSAAFNNAVTGLDTATANYKKAAKGKDGNPDEAGMLQAQQQIQSSQRVMAFVQEMLRMMHQNAMEMIRNLRTS